LQVIQQLRDPQKGISISDRNYHGKVYKKCFIGSDMVDWLLKNGFASTREDAVRLGNDLLKHNVFRHVTSDHDFKDEYLFYRFIEDEYPELVAQVKWEDVINNNNNNNNNNNTFEEEQKKGNDAARIENASFLSPNLSQKPVTDTMLREQALHLIEQLNIYPLDPPNFELLNCVRPLVWQNPQVNKKDTYNIVVLGAGAAGLVTAAASAGLGAKVALIEERLLGGDCLNYGCVPSKALLRCASLIHQIRTGHHFGVKVKDVEVDFAAIMERMRKLRASLSHNDSVKRFRSLGVDVFIGHGEFTGKNAIQVNGTTLKFSKACIATGAEPAIPPIEGLSEIPFLTNVTLFKLTKLPKTFGIIGGGPAGCEMAQAFQRFGSQVYLLEVKERVLSREDPTASQIIEKSLKDDGVKVYCGVKIERVSKLDNNEIVIEFYNECAQQKLNVEQLLVVTGRKPRVQNIGLEAAGVKYDTHMGVYVNDMLQTSNSDIYACGDVSTMYKFTHVADAMARIVVRNALFLGRSKVSDLFIPWCTYTEPALAHCGASERDLIQRGVKFTTFQIDFKEVDRALLDGDTDGFVKVWVKEGSDKILGATIVGNHAADLISELTVCMKHDIGLSGLAEVIHPYPTMAESLRKLGDQYNRTRLTPFVKMLFRKFNEFRR